MLVTGKEKWHEKELVARAIPQQSKRSRSPRLIDRMLRCRIHLLERVKLFGHEAQYAFTRGDIVRSSVGLLRRAR